MGSTTITTRMRAFPLLIGLAVIIPSITTCGGAENSAESAASTSTTGVVPSPAAPDSDTQLTSAIGSLPRTTQSEIVALLTSGDIPSFAGAIVVNDRLEWVGGSGDQPAANAVYMVGSIDKTFIATAVFQLVEQGLIDPEADINTYLPFEVRNPEHPDTAVTIRQLLLHRSGLVGDLPDAVWYDNDPTIQAWAVEHLDVDLSDNPYPQGTPALGVYLESHFGGSDDGLWLFEPGMDWKYSNLAIHLLLSYIVERVSGMDIAAYVEEHIFAPLGMDNSGFEASAFPPGQLVVPYTRIDGVNTALPLTGQHTSGRLRTTASDLARFLGAHMNGGRFDGVRILESESIQMMHEGGFTLRGMDSGQLPFRGVGHGWWLWTEGRSGHGGGTPGFLAKMVMQETDDGTVGIVALINVGCSLTCDQGWKDSTFVPLREVLLEAARTKLGS